ncbi:hypothetical protein AB1Y20_018474 [Prymnesium parvum]|uniref:SRCR domain-containing protein n=1 Tax=Prymnesium parvum TaxID=97485 RepID=A0AB34JRQ2_PRYPA
MRAFSLPLLPLLSLLSPARTAADEPPPLAPTITAVQMAGCNTDCGRVEVRTSSGGAWQSVCSPHWTLAEATVVCRSLGFSKAVGAIPAFGGGPAAALSSVVCSGDEARLSDCRVEAAPSSLACEAVGVSCQANTAETEQAYAEAAAGGEATASAWARRRERRAVLPPPGDGADCLIAPRVALPFHAAAEAYVFPEQLADAFAEMDRGLRRRLCAEGWGAEVQRVVANLTARGMKANALGVDLSAVLPRATQEERAVVHELYLSYNPQSALHFEFDQPLREQTLAAPRGWVRRSLAALGARLARRRTHAAANASGSDDEADVTPPERFLEGDSAATALYSTLQRDGIALVSDFGLAASDLDEISRRFAELHASGGAEVSSVSGGDVVTARAELPMLEALLSNRSVGRALQAYLGGGVTLDGYKVTRLGTSRQQDVSAYVAARWHHDRAGRRVKIFLFLHDVDCTEGHPTRVAAGTHNLLYYRTEEFPHTRFTDSFIEAEYNVTLGCGKRGGGFIFDTHTVHKGTPEGTLPRTTVIIEAHNSLKCPAVRAMGLPIPCPSGDQYRLNRLLAPTDAQSCRA